MERERPSWRWLSLGAMLALTLLVSVVARGLAEARQAPVIRRASIALPAWPRGAAPLRVALVSDLHLGNRATDAARLGRVVNTINGTRPDLIVLAGDFVAGHAAGLAEGQAPALTRELARLRARLGVIATLGNHDYWTGEAAVRGALRGAGVTLLENAVARRGPLTVAGIGDDYTGHARVRETMAQATRTGGPLLVVTHSPDIAPALPPAATLLLAGHTHCGQVVLPIIGAAVIPSRFGARYRCGIKREGERRVVVTAGIGASNLPLRIEAPPDFWLLTLGPEPVSPPRP